MMSAVCYSCYDFEIVFGCLCVFVCGHVVVVCKTHPRCKFLNVYTARTPYCFLHQ